MKNRTPTVQRQARKLHRWLVPIAATPLLLTAGSGALYSLLLEQGIDAFWLLQLHTGRLGPLNLQPYYSLIVGALTLVVVISGLSLLWQPQRPG